MNSLTQRLTLPARCLTALLTEAAALLALFRRYNTLCFVHNLMLCALQQLLSYPTCSKEVCHKWLKPVDTKQILSLPGNLDRSCEIGAPIL